MRKSDAAVLAGLGRTSPDLESYFLQSDYSHKQLTIKAGR